MKGIILKDLYDNFCIPKNAASYIFGGGIAILFSLLARNHFQYVLFVGIIFPMLGGCAAEASTEQDETANINKLLITFPVTKTEIVLSKYLLGFGFLAATNILSLTLAFVHVFLFHTLTLSEALHIFGLGVGVSLAFLAASYLGYFLLGKRWGTIFFISVTLLFGALYGTASSMLGVDIFLSCDIWVILVCLLIGAILTGLSFAISTKVFKRRYS